MQSMTDKKIPFPGEEEEISAIKIKPQRNQINYIHKGVKAYIAHL